MTEEPAVKEEPIKFLAKANCKHCRGRGFVTRTHPIGKDGQKKMSKRKTLCSCVTEIKTPEPDECIVPKVAKDGPKKIYACAAQPLH
jgi:hypothetical protein